ncbi:hypothetical protein [Halalkalibacter okhensis]|uniref:Uncharacterized protein n=1 Tax=Halalkalibacter okhensis TaxID=333138 RepID=A0A0B0IDL9_9BACI|nr:hypothetical protein [Halalkalibacter okhensis]KHF40698.1 hypothetical protein LQ50_07855 [Halalkalibacter okhensis]
MKKINALTHVKLIIWRRKLSLVFLILFFSILWFLQIDILKILGQTIVNIIPLDLSDPASAGLFGAIAGGILSFMGSIITQRKQFKNKGIVFRKNVIYTPLYDDLRKLKTTLTENHYPTYLVFKKNDPFINFDYPVFLAWERINSDVRSIEVPKYLADTFNRLEKSGESYLEARSKASKEIYLELSKLTHIFDQKTLDMYDRSGDSFYLNELIENEDIPLEKINTKYRFKHEYSNENLLEIKACINSCKNFESIERVILKYEEFTRILDDLITALEKLISFIQIKYEHKNKNY